MHLEFSKYQGAGNDFIMVDNRDASFPKKNYSWIEKLCDRRYGIGADGLILLENSDDADFRMVYFNADGKESTMCGNGGRCIMAYAKKLGVIEQQAEFVAIDGMHQAKILNDGQVELGMQDVLDIEEVRGTEFVLNTGSPHYVVVLDEMPTHILELAKKIRFNSRFASDGINVNFIKIDQNKVTIRTYERGVEDETLACGTGSVAAAVVASKFFPSNSFRVQTQGGDLKVDFTPAFEEVFLTGPADFVFSGTMSN